MLEWLLSFLRKMTDEQKRELARAFPPLCKALGVDANRLLGVEEDKK